MWEGARGLLLALGAIEGGSVGLNDAPDGGVAGVASLGFPVVDAQGLFEVTRLAVLVEEVPQGGAAHFDGGGENLANGGGESFETWEADFAGGEGGANAGHKQGFTGINVANADDTMAVHDQGFDGGLAIAGEVVEMAGGEFRAEGFGAEIFEEGVKSGVAVNPLNGAEAARVVEAEFHSGVEAQGNMVVFAPGN